MQIPKSATIAAICLMTLGGIKADVLVTTLSPGAAVYDGARIATTATGVPQPDLALGHAFNIEFAPVAGDLSGTVLLMEIGGTANGTGLYLINGVLVYITKHGGTDAAVPSGLNDTSIDPAAAVSSTFAPLTAGVTYSAAASWSQASELVLAVKPAGGAMTREVFTLSGTFGNWSGDESFSVGQNPRISGGGPGGTVGGLAGEGVGNEPGAPFDVESDADVQLLKSFAGTISRALYWNAVGEIASGVTAAPAFSLKPGTYTVIESLTLTSDPGATVFYTTDGSTPTASSPSGPSPVSISIPSSVTVKAYATRPGYQDSMIETAAYVIEVPMLRHRYSFDGAPGTTTITDSAGGAHGTLINGSDAATLGGGKLVLDGNFSSGYVELPAGIISKLTNATFMSWVSWDGGNAWQRIWDFGTNSAVGQNVSAAYLCPFGGDFGALLFGFNFAGEQRVNAGSQLVKSTEVCVTVRYNYFEKLAAIYVGGKKVASGKIDKAFFNLPDVYNWLGRAKYNDPYFAGSFNEFRIYSGAQTDLQIAVAAAAGPDTMVTDPGALASVEVTAGQTSYEVQSLGGPLQVLATFANVANVDVTTLSGTSITSSDPAVASVVNGNIVPMGVGKAVVSASYGGKSASVTVTVTDTSAWPGLLHRYSFSDSQGTVVTDSVGSIHGTFYGVGTFTGSQLVMPAGNPPPLADGTPNPNSGWVSFPAGQGLVTGLPSQASIECWVVWNGGAVWQEIWDFGQAATPGYSLGGGRYVMVCPYDGATGALRAEWFPGGTLLTGPRPPVGVLSQIVLTHDQDRQVDKLYLNGQLVASGVNTWLWTDLPDTDNWLARDQWPDAFFNGAYDELRFWNGALTAGQVASAYKAGPDRIVGPDLKITRSGNQVTLKWPANATGFLLESTSDLSGTWSAVAGTPVVEDGLNHLNQTIGSQPVYYRLKQ